MAARKTFRFEFEDEGPKTLSFDYDGQYEQRLESAVENGAVVLYLNRQGCAVLAKVLAKMALGSYEPGFHLHFEKDFNAEQKEVLRLVLVSDRAGGLIVD
jgi:hypothetical protein